MAYSKSTATRCSLTLATFLALGTSGCSKLCQSDELQRVPSVDGASDAVVLRRNCGAATAERTAVVVVPRGGSLPSTRFGDAFRVKGNFTIEVAWAADTLVITHGPGVPIEEAVDHTQGRPIRLVLRR